MVNNFKSDLIQLSSVSNGEFIEKLTRVPRNYLAVELGSCKVAMYDQQQQCLYVGRSNGSKPKLP